MLTNPEDKRGKLRKLSCMNEAFLYLTFVKSARSQKQMALEFRISESSVSRIIIKWAAIIYCIRKAFGEYLSYEEQMALDPKEWLEKYGNTWCILWDTTDIKLAGAPSDAVLQFLTYSEYYAANVFKGGVGMTPGGWCVGGVLCNGRMQDTEYMEKSGIFLWQQKLQEIHGGPPVTTVADKGMRCLCEAKKYGTRG